MGATVLLRRKGVRVTSNFPCGGQQRIGTIENDKNYNISMPLLLLLFLLLVIPHDFDFSLLLYMVKSAFRVNIYMTPSSF